MRAKRVVILLALAVLALTSARTRADEKVDEVLKRLRAANKELKNMKARVTYTKAIPLLEEKRTCKGSLRFLPPDHMHLKLGDPRNEEVLTDGKIWLVIDHGAKQVERYRVTKDQKQNQEAAFLSFGYGGNIDELKKGYEIKLVETKEKDEVTLWRLRFNPKKEAGPTRFSQVETVISSKRNLPVEIKLYESEGEMEHVFALSEIKLNTDMEKKDFDLSLPKGFAVIDPD